MLNIEAVVIDPFDRELQALMARCVTQVTTAAPAQLAALAHPAARQPALVVLDLRGGKRVPAALAGLRQAHPDTAVVIVASAADPALMLETMRAGASEFLVEPLTHADLEAAVLRVVSRQKPTTLSGELFAFIGAKGGVGTTTTAVNVAAALGKLGKGKTLLIDLHLAHGDTAILLGAEPKFSVVDALENTHRLDEAFLAALVTPTKSNLDLLPSSESALARMVGAAEVRALLQLAAQVYRYVVLDVPRSDAAALDALDLVSRVVVVANQELTAIRSASRIAAALRQRYGKDKLQVIVNRYDKQAEITRDDVERVVVGKVRHVIPNDYRVALQALNAGRPLAVQNHNRLTSAYQELARSLAGLEPDDQKGGESGRLFSMFGPRR